MQFLAQPLGPWLAQVGGVQEIHTISWLLTNFLAPDQLLGSISWLPTNFLAPTQFLASPLSERMPITALSPCVNEDMESRTLDANNCVVALYDDSI